MMRDAVKVEIFGDVLCPWCYIGLHRVELALGMVAEPVRDRLEPVWRCHALIPDAPKTPGPTVPEAMAGYLPAEQVPARIALIESTGSEHGLVIDLAGTRQVSSFDAHRLLALAADRGCAAELWRLLFRAHFSEHRVISSTTVLAELGVEAGLAEDEVTRLLTGTERAEQVRADYRRSAESGVTAIPSIVLDGGRPISGLAPAAEVAELLGTAVSNANRS
ncbi:DsbA family protein [Saccharopolyspora gloriosae]|uniref:DsbA family oxidoreductase n=1 Tax=Saccharopolyspora gloriosae TaxID=455344 RepID=UPI001FB60900|nr:DsbA family oxidoreductase [Saccharopolyspora gloriosae]